MEIEYFGANCFRIKTKNATLIVDDNLEDLGSKSPTKDSDVLLVTSDVIKPKKAAQKARLVLDSAGEYEVGDVSVKALQTRGHMDEEGKESATVYQFMFGGATVTVLGHIHPEVSAEVVELAGGTDVLVIPTGGNGFTLDPVGAVSVIKRMEPDVVIPSSYDVDGLKFEVPATPLEDFVKTSALTAEEPVDSYKVGKTTNEAGQTQLVVMQMKKA